MCVLPFLLLAGLVAPASPKTPSPAEAARAWMRTHEPAVLREFGELLSLPNLASDAVNIGRNADHIKRMLERRDLAVTILDGAGGPPAVYAERKAPGATRTIVVYAHYDGQPVVESQWSSPPFAPVLLDAARPGGKAIDLSALAEPAPAGAFLYARSAGDDKAPIQALVSALDALDAAQEPLSVNLKVFLEGEEEAGSTHLRAVLEREKARLAADAWLFCDGPVHQTRRPLLGFGVRGITDVEITLYGPARPLHSGHYGNWAPNPAVEMAQLLSKLRDDEGRILIDRFYENVRPPTEAEKRAIAEAPDAGPLLRDELFLGRTEGGGARLDERILLPALNVRGLRSGNVGAEAQNAVPGEARMSIDFRLVPDQTPARVRERLEAHLLGLGYVVVHETPTPQMRRTTARLVKLEWGPGYAAYRADLTSPIARGVRRALERAMGQAPVQSSGGGSLPLSIFAETLGAPIIMLPIANHDDNQHAADENLRVQNLRDAVAIYAEVLATLGRDW